jgi:hypothetical protein
LIQGHTIIQYDYYEALVPGVAFEKVEEGNYVCRSAD